ncbi:hypothetical protein ACFFKH_16920 [Micromonospora marina]|uniref:Uncharacterized protein n=1 Tax=Micromonospora marina TaxID=307120 RepID=A0A1C5AG73_9ACTN|nr:hypothetical protein [Micromonospora marina]SCF44051.1 hypothetical protein GA0070215_12933 [Micromonospora marina]
MVRSGPAVGRHVVGSALVLHARDRISAEARSLALGMAGDADHDIVLLDLHDALPVGIWETVARELPRRRRGIRLVVCGAAPDVTALAGQWLADRLRRPVVAPHGHLVAGAAGVLFVHAGRDSGWVRHRPGRNPVWTGKRHPRPEWDGAASAYLSTSAYRVVEPLPGGVWLRDTRDAPGVTRHWRRLALSVPCQPQVLTVVLGCPETAPLPLDDVARFWRRLPAAARRQTRFVAYGPVRLPAGAPLGQALADTLDTPVVCYSGLPVGDPEHPRIHTVPVDGGPGWQVHARELGYRPRPWPWPGTAACLPHIVSHRTPEALGEVVAPRVHRYTDDAVVEILQSGLWVRPPEAPRHGARVRARLADPDVHTVVVDDADPALVPRLRELADDLVARLDAATRARSVLHLASGITATAGPASESADRPATGNVTYRFTAFDLGLDVPLRPPTEAPPTALRPAGPVPVGTGPVAFPPVSAVPATSVPVCGPAAEPLSIQSPPDPEARATPGPDLQEADRAWLRRVPTDQAAAAAEEVPGTLGEEPHAAAGTAAVRLYLSPAGAGLDAALRSGRPGRRISFARCVAAGLDRLPVHRGPALLRADLTVDRLRAVAAHRTLTDRGFTNAVVEAVALPGTVDVLIWSVGGRLTRMLEPANGVPVRVLFRPGTTFKVLAAVDPAPDRPGRLFLRELVADEPDRDHVPFDSLALTSLRQSIPQLTATRHDATLDAADLGRFGAIPGVR